MYYIFQAPKCFGALLCNILFKVGFISTWSPKEKKISETMTYAGLICKKISALI